MIGKLLDWISLPIRLHHDNTANVCERGHIFVVWAGDPMPSAPPHIDLNLKLWTSQILTTAHEMMTAEAAGQTVDGHFKEMILEPGGAPKTQTLELYPPKGEQLQAKPGDTVRIVLRLTRGGRRKLKVPIT